MCDKCFFDKCKCKLIQDSQYEEIEDLEKIKSVNKGLAEGWTRVTFIIQEDINEKIKALAYWERLTVKEIINEALTTYLKDKNIRSFPRKL